MKHQRISLSIAVAAVMSAAAFVPAAHAIDINAGDWKVSIDGNVNAHYIYSRCDTNPAIIAGGLACIDTDSSSSSVSNGLLPAALSISGATTQGAYDIGFTFGLYPGISTNNGGSPNLGTTPGTTPVHTALGTAGLDIRQVFLTFGNKDMGTVMAGRNIGFFGGDAILNDMTLLGVGAGNGSYAAPANTSLGSIGLAISIQTGSRRSITRPPTSWASRRRSVSSIPEHPEPDSGLEEGAWSSSQGRVYGGTAVSLGKRFVPATAQYHRGHCRGPDHQRRLQQLGCRFRRQVRHRGVRGRGLVLRG